jgi:ABC-type nickel/cobalt efflux system permease component RcnA
MSDNNSNITGAKIKYNLKNWICGSPFLNKILTNPFTMSIMLLTIILLLDLLYGKNFESTSTREIIQHSSTVLFVMIAGIFLNNLALTKCNKINGGSDDSYNNDSSDKHHSTHNYDSDDHKPSDKHRHIDKYDDVLSRYE